MATTIEKKFRITSSIDDVWSFVANPARVAVCLPGVELTATIDDVTYAGNVRVKVGPMTVAYAGEARVTERDDRSRTLKMVGKGKEKGGAGSAKMELVASVIGVEGGVEVDVRSTLVLTGKVVRLGRGMIEAVSDQLFEEFVARLRANLEASKPASDEAPAGTGADAPKPASHPSPEPPSNLARSAKPVAALPLFFKALLAMFKRFWSRILGRNRTPEA